ncbi:MAG: FtsX-like permease family protein [Spirochaetes bacterium]|nr:FtsX-like permease family protein [Spirochaetota bacterium]
MSRTKPNYIYFAFRNLGRHKVKTALTMTAIIIGIMAYIYIDCMLYGADIESQRNLVNFETGSAKIYSQVYFERKDERPLYEGFKDHEKLITKLNEAGYAAAPHAVFSGTLISKDNEIPFMFIGIDPDQEKTVFRYHNYVEEGQYLQENKFEIMLGVKGAKRLKVKKGDSLRLTTTIDKKDERGKVHHTHQVIDLQVSGIINTPNPYANGNIGFIPLDILQDDMGIRLEGTVSEIVIRIKDAALTQLPSEKEKPEVILSTIGDIPSDLILVSWEVDAKDYLAISSTKKGGTGVILMFLFIIVAAGISNTILMATFERTKELGMLRALGMKDGEILKAFLYEAFLIGLFGTLMGLIIGTIINYFMVNYGIDYTFMMEQMNIDDFGYRVTGVFRSAWSIKSYVTALIFGMLIPVLAAIMPSLKVIKKPITDALRFE